MWLVGGVHRTVWFFYWGVVHHPVCVIICSWSLYFYKMYGPTPSIFSFAGFSAVSPYETLEVQVHMLSLRFFKDPRRACLVHPWCSLVSILSDSTDLYFFLEAPLYCLWAFSSTLAWRVLSVLRHAFLVNSGCSLARLPDSLLLGVILFAVRAQWSCKIIGPRLLI